ncbi:MAG: pentapeptide repeat-containing protein, partial [Proteobacteria bacterium]|nr:pentapeptide repeat-containing protein [Pseudomonadota bacterium]
MACFSGACFSGACFSWGVSASPTPPSAAGSSLAFFFGLGAGLGGEALSDWGLASAEPSSVGSSFNLACFSGACFSGACFSGACFFEACFSGEFLVAR